MIRKEILRDLIPDLKGWGGWWFRTKVEGNNYRARQTAPPGWSPKQWTVSTMPRARRCCGRQAELSHIPAKAPRWRGLVRQPLVFAVSVGFIGQPADETTTVCCDSICCATPRSPTSARTAPAITDLCVWISRSSGNGWPRSYAEDVGRCASGSWYQSSPARRMATGSDS